MDSLKAKLELTQNELFTLHNSNLDLTSQLRQTQSQIQCSTGSSTNKKYSFTTANSSQNTSVSSTSSANGTKTSLVYESSRSSFVAEELARTQKELAKQTSEILALKNQLSLNQVCKVNLVHFHSVDFTEILSMCSFLSTDHPSTKSSVS